MNTLEKHEDAKKAFKLLPLPVNYVAKLNKILPDTTSLLKKKGNGGGGWKQNVGQQKRGPKSKLESLNLRVQGNVQLKGSQVLPQVVPYASAEIEMKAKHTPNKALKKMKELPIRNTKRQNNSNDSLSADVNNKINTQEETKQKTTIEPVATNNIAASHCSTPPPSKSVVLADTALINAALCNAQQVRYIISRKY